MGLMSREDFDAIVTGELTHQAIWLEDQIVEIITDFFSPANRSIFTRVLMRRDGLTFQDKIEILRAILPEFKKKQTADRLKELLKEVEEFKAFRNAFAHGHDNTPDHVRGPHLFIEIVTRSGKEKEVEVTSDSHRELMEKASELYNSISAVREQLKGS